MFLDRLSVLQNDVQSELFLNRLSVLVIVDIKSSPYLPKHGHFDPVFRDSKRFKVLKETNSKLAFIKQTLRIQTEFNCYQNKSQYTTVLLG